MKEFNFNFMKDFSIQVLWQLMFTLLDSRISLIVLIFPSREAWIRVNSIETTKIEKERLKIWKF